MNTPKPRKVKSVSVMRSNMMPTSVSSRKGADSGAPIETTNKYLENPGAGAARVQTNKIASRLTLRRCQQPVLCSHRSSREPIPFTVSPSEKVADSTVHKDSSPIKRESNFFTSSREKPPAAASRTLQFVPEGECLSDEGLISTACNTPDSGPMRFGSTDSPVRVPRTIFSQKPQSVLSREYSVRLPQTTKPSAFKDTAARSRLPSNFTSFIDAHHIAGLETPVVPLVEKSEVSEIPQLEQQPAKPEENLDLPQSLYNPTEILKRRRIAVDSPISFLKHPRTDSNPLWKDVQRLAARQPESGTQVTLNQSDLGFLLSPGEILEGSSRFMDGSLVSGPSLEVSNFAINKKPRSRSILMNKSSKRLEKQGSCHLANQSTKRVSFNPYKMVFCFAPSSR